MEKMFIGRDAFKDIFSETEKLVRQTFVFFPVLDNFQNCYWSPKAVIGIFIFPLLHFSLGPGMERIIILHIPA